jgi:hypothetical protein
VRVSDKLAIQAPQMVGQIVTLPNHTKHQISEYVNVEALNWAQSEISCVTHTAHTKDIQRQPTRPTRKAITRLDTRYPQTIQ